jgi:hypothetical protein
VGGEYGRGADGVGGVKVGAGRGGIGEGLDAPPLGGLIGRGGE